MVNVEINKELDDYISAKRRKPLMANVRQNIAMKYNRVMDRVSKDKNPEPEEITVDIGKDAPLEEEDFDEDRDFEEMEQEIEEKPTIMKRFSEWFHSGDTMDEQQKPKEEKFEEELEDLEREEEELEQQESEIKSKENRVWAKMASLFSRRIPEETKHLDSEVGDLREDMRTIAKIATEIMQKLPPGTFREFKNSHRYEEFVKILERHELVKRTEEKSEKINKPEDKNSDGINVFRLGN